MIPVDIIPRLIIGPVKELYMWTLGIVGDLIVYWPWGP